MSNPTTGTRRAWAVAAVAASVALLGGSLSSCSLLPAGATEAPAPVVVMTWAPQDTNATNMPGMIGMAEAYARKVDATGGINGHRFKVITCNEHNDPVQAQHCAQQAVQAHAVAVVGSYSPYGQDYLATLESAGIPYLGGYGISTDEFSSPDSYPVNGGAPALLTGIGRQLSADCNRTALVRPDTAAGDQYAAFLDAGLAYRHRRAARDIHAPEAAGDYTAQAQDAVGSGTPGHCVTAVLGGRTGAFFDAFRRIRHGAVRTASVLGSLKQSLVNSTGGADSPLEGAYATGWYPSAGDPRWADMRQAVTDYAFGDTRIDVTGPGEQTTWIAYTVLEKIVRSLGDGPVTATTVHRALDRAQHISTGGLTPPLGWRYADLLGVPDYPRMVNADVTFQVVKDGLLTAVGKGDFVDLGAALETATAGH